MPSISETATLSWASDRARVRAARQAGGQLTGQRLRYGSAVAHAIHMLLSLPMPQPQVTDDIEA